MNRPLRSNLPSSEISVKHRAATNQSSRKANQTINCAAKLQNLQFLTDSWLQVELEQTSTHKKNVDFDLIREDLLGLMLPLENKRKLYAGIPTFVRRVAQ